MPDEQTRKWREPKEMSTDDIAACYELAVRLRRHEPGHDLDSALDKWLDRARGELRDRKELERVRPYLAVFYDPARRNPVYGPGAPLASQAAIEQAITQCPAPARAITAGGTGGTR